MPLPRTLIAFALGAVVASIPVLALVEAQAPAPPRPAGWVHPFDVPQPDPTLAEVLGVVEIPAGGSIKYELDKKTGYPVVDRFQSMSVAYPANYGCFPQTLAGDGDPLDFLVYTRSPLAVGSFIPMRLIGVMRSTDGGDQDDKLLAVPTSKVDPTYDNIKTIDDLPPIELQRLKEFFLTYKRIPEGRKKVEVHGFAGPDDAKAILRQAAEQYKATRN